MRRPPEIVHKPEDVSMPFVAIFDAVFTFGGQVNWMRWANFLQSSTCSICPLAEYSGCNHIPTSAYLQIELRFFADHVIVLHCQKLTAALFLHQQTVKFQLQIWYKYSRILSIIRIQVPALLSDQAPLPTSA